MFSASTPERFRFLLEAAPTLCSYTPTRIRPGEHNETARWLSRPFRLTDNIGDENEDHETQDSVCHDGSGRFELAPRASGRRAELLRYRSRLAEWRAEQSFRPQHRG